MFTLVLACGGATTANLSDGKAATYGSGEESVFRKLTIVPSVNGKSRYDIWYVLPGSSHVVHLAYRIKLTMRSADGRTAFFSTRSAKSACDDFKLKEIDPSLFDLTSGQQSILVSPIDEAISANNIRTLLFTATTNRSDKNKRHSVLVPMIIPKCRV